MRTILLEVLGLANKIAIVRKITRVASETNEKAKMFGNASQ